MTNERNKILDLLEKEVINTEEAIKLLKTLSPNPVRFTDDFADIFYSAIFLTVVPELYVANKYALRAVATFLDDVSHSLRI